MALDKYKIRRFEEEELKPEETLADSLSIHSALETPIGRGVFNGFYLTVALFIIFFVFKSVQLQLVSGANYAASAEQNSALRYQLLPLRGLVYDSNNNVMVDNLPIFDLVAVHSLLTSSVEKLSDQIRQLAPILGVKEGDLSKTFDENKDRGSFLIKGNITKEQIIKINSLSLGGIFTVANAQRHYPDGPASAHLLGHTSKVTPDDLKKDPSLLVSDRIGRVGLEAEYEDYLRGPHRGFDFKKDADSQADDYTGQSLFLNIDNNIQKQLYKSIASVFASAGVRRGAAIIQNPKTGAVLGLVSMPAFDNNIFENSSLTEKTGGILNNSDKPLLNRAISGRYSPGSTIKPLLALAGLREGVVTPSTMVFANGSISVRSEVDPNVFYTFRDWRVHGWTDIKKAIADSVDVYFYALGGGYNGIKGLGIQKIASYIKGAGADKVTGIDLPGEISGFVPDADWKKESKGEPWYVGDTYNISIGQGDLGVTPVWINSYVGAVANWGNIMKPEIVREIKNQDGKVTKHFDPVILSQLPFDHNTLDIVRQGMRQTVLSGTSTLLQDVPAALAAKTGTAQITGHALNSLFTVFGPYEDPDITMTVLVENINQSQGLAIRVANDFMLWYFKEYKKAQGQ